MKYISILVLTLIALCSKLSAADYGYFFSTPGDTQSNKVNVGSNEILEFPNVSHSDYHIDSADSLVAVYEEALIEVEKGTSHWAFSGKKLFGPCEVYISIGDHFQITRFLPYKLYEKEGVRTPENLLVIPANASDGGMELIVQSSADSSTWSNITLGNIDQTNQPIFCKLVISGVNNETISANTSFGFGSSNPKTEITYQKFLPSGTQSEAFLTLNEGQLFVPHFPMLGGGEVIIRAYINSTLSNVFVCGYNNEQVEAFPGPAVLSHSGNNSNKDAILNYSIVEEIEQNSMSCGIVTIPAGSGSYAVGIQYSDDLVNWQQMSQGSQPSPSSGIRFYRLSAVANN
jgi:hypothetical protein